MDQRKFKRLPVKMEIALSKLFKQDHVVVEIGSDIDVTDISKGGIGFICSSDLPLDFYFNASLRLGDDESVLYVVAQILYKWNLEDGKFRYGCEFVGLADVLEYIFDDFEKSLHQDEY